VTTAADILVSIATKNPQILMKSAEFYKDAHRVTDREYQAQICFKSTNKQQAISL